MSTRAKTAQTAAFEDATAQAKATVETLVKAGQDAAAKGYEQVVVAAKEQVEKANAQLLKGYEEYAAFGKQNVDAFVQSGSIVAKGMEEMSKAVFAFTQASLEAGVATGKAMLAVKTLRELVDLQAGFAKSSLDGFVAEGTKLSEMGVKVANQALEPINARVHAAVEKLAKPAAAA